MKSPFILIVDDEPDICELLEITLNRMNFKTCRAMTLQAAKEYITRHKFDLCLTDLRLPDGNGIDLLDYIAAIQQNFPTVVISAHGNMDTAIVAMKKGAFDFIAKPIDLTVLRQIIATALKLRATKDDVLPNKIVQSEQILFGNSAAMVEIRAKIDKLARSQAPVYVRGESGSGKELVSTLIHKKSPRAENAFIAINCGAIPPELMESEFFGHIKGSFTGAIADKKGFFEMAAGGTLFLDEVADLPLNLQVKLLRALQEKKIRPIGGQKEISVDIRLLSATNKDLALLVNEGKFRQDLYYRINVIELHIPPLRQRAADIPLLVERLLTKLTTNVNNRELPKLSNQALEALKQYYFPGNVRELENILECALTLSEDKDIELADLNLSNDNATLNTTIPSDNNIHDSIVTEAYNYKSTSLESYLEKIERNIIHAALDQHKWNKVATAKHLGISARSLRYRLKKLDLE